jgi:hypothetical protein
VTATGEIRWWAGNALIYPAVTDAVVTYCWPRYAEHPPPVHRRRRSRCLAARRPHQRRAGYRPAWLPGVEKVDTLRMYGKRWRWRCCAAWPHRRRVWQAVGPCDDQPVTRFAQRTSPRLST